MDDGILNYSDSFHSSRKENMTTRLTGGHVLYDLIVINLF